MISMVRLIFILFISLALTPVYVGLGLVLLLTGGLGYLRFSRAHTVASPPVARESASLIILNWNGKELLAEGLPSVIRAVARDGRPHEVLVVDNGSTDDSVA